MLEQICIVNRTVPKICNVMGKDFASTNLLPSHFPPSRKGNESEMPLITTGKRDDWRPFDAALFIASPNTAIFATSGKNWIRVVLEVHCSVFLHTVYFNIIAAHQISTFSKPVSVVFLVIGRSLEFWTANITLYCDTYYSLLLVDRSTVEG